MRVTVITSDGATVDLRTDRDDPDALDDLVARAKTLLTHMSNEHAVSD